jgi:hypothetical protein
MAKKKTEGRVSRRPCLPPFRRAPPGVGPLFSNGVAWHQEVVKPRVRLKTLQSGRCVGDRIAAKVPRASNPRGRLYTAPPDQETPEIHRAILPGNFLRPGRRDGFAAPSPAADPPASGARGDRIAAPGGRVGIASSRRRSWLRSPERTALEFDVMIVLDVSGSTENPSGGRGRRRRIGVDPALELLPPGAFPEGSRRIPTTRSCRPRRRRHARWWGPRSAAGASDWSPSPARST